MSRLLSYQYRLMAATGLLSVALIACQVAMIQLLSVVQWHHFANMVISVALLGFGCAGTVLSLMRNRLLAHSHVLLPLLMILAGLAMVGAVLFSRSGFARFDSYILFVDRKQWLALLLNYLLFFFPFFAGAVALGIVFVKYVDQIGKFYSSNLIGSGIGAIAAAGLSSYFFPTTLPAIIAMISILSGLLLVTRKNIKFLLPVGLVAIAITCYSIVKPARLELSEYKSLSRTMNMPSAKIILQKPGPFGFVEVVSAEGLRYAPGLSLAFTGEVPVQKVIFNNGDWFGPIAAWSAGDSIHLFDYTTMALPYVLGKKNKVLVLHAGTGMHLSHALHNGSLSIDAVEPHRGVIDLLLHRLARDNDSLYYQPAINLHATEPRTFLSTTHKKYDLVQVPMVGAFGGTAGLYAMREEYTLTKEAFIEMWNLLEKDGTISISSWMDYPFRNPLKIAATIAEMAEQVGLSQLHSHLVAVRSWGTISFLLKKSTFTSVDTANVRAFCNNNFFDPVILPGMSTSERTVYNGMADTSFFSYIDQLLFGQRKQLYKEYDFSIEPATDDKPYFSQFLRWKSLSHLNEVFGTQSAPFLELGWLIAIMTFFQISLLAILLIVLPLFRIERKRGGKVWTLLYFSGLGIGYMFLEIVLVQKFILFFGNPVYSAAFVIGGMLLASGAGSYFSSRLGTNRFVLRRILLMIVILLLCYSFFLPGLLRHAAGFPVVLKNLIFIISIALPGFLMGIPFPMGLKLLSDLQEKNIPWAWGINGCMSVISAALVSLLAVETGLMAVMLLAAAAYLLCLLSMYIYRSN